MRGLGNVARLLMAARQKSRDDARDLPAAIYPSVPVFLALRLSRLWARDFFSLLFFFFFLFFCSRARVIVHFVIIGGIFFFLIFDLLRKNIRYVPRTIVYRVNYCAIIYRLTYPMLTSSIMINRSEFFTRKRKIRHRRIFRVIFFKLEERKESRKKLLILSIEYFLISPYLSLSLSLSPK